MAIRQGLGVYGDMSGDDSEWKAREPFPGTLTLLAFASTTVQILTPEALRARQADVRLPQFTCFTCLTSTKVHILTPEALRARQAELHGGVHLRRQHNRPGVSIRTFVRVKQANLLVLFLYE